MKTGLVSKFSLVSTTILLSSSLQAATLGCFGYTGPSATTESTFIEEVDITKDMNDPQVEFKEYEVIHRDDFTVSVTIEKATRRMLVSLSRNGLSMMALHSFENAMLLLYDEKTKTSIVSVTCSVTSIESVTGR